jgi:hypothetical protein
MRIPRFWAKAEGSAEGPRGDEFPLRLWGWSDQSAAEALAVARRRLAEVAARIASGDLTRKYPYGERPLREEIVRAQGGAEPAALVTRNRYGALVLNAARVPFVDVDAPEPPQPVRRLFGFLSRRRAGQPDAQPDGVLERIRQTCRRHDRHSFRIYRTRAGYRLLATDLLLDPTSAEARELLTSFGSDPRFVKLCEVQECFRARLTPKPWRCGYRLPPGQYPREDAQARARFAEWLRGYESACERFATCRYLESVGPGRQLPETREIVEEHDRVTRAATPLPLA